MVRAGPLGRRVRYCCTAGREGPLGGRNATRYFRRLRPPHSPQRCRQSRVELRFGLLAPSAPHATWEHAEHCDQRAHPGDGGQHTPPLHCSRCARWPLAPPVRGNQAAAGCWATQHRQQQRRQPGGTAAAHRSITCARPPGIRTPLLHASCVFLTCMIRPGDPFPTFDRLPTTGAVSAAAAPPAAPGRPGAGSPTPAPALHR